jgi:VanZ family protein
MIIFVAGKNPARMFIYLYKYKFSIIVASVIVLLSLIPSSSLPDSSLFSISFFDKIVHFGMYGFFSLVALLEMRRSEPCHQRHLIVLSAIFFMSFVIEVLQATVVASRSAEWLDLLANLFGLTAGYVSYRFIRLIRS